jgi:hypothetical protein
MLLFIVRHPRKDKYAIVDPEVPQRAHQHLGIAAHENAAFDERARDAVADNRTNKGNDGLGTVTEVKGRVRIDLLLNISAGPSKV